MEYMLISGTEPSSVIRHQTKYFKKLKNQKINYGWLGFSIGTKSSKNLDCFSFM